MDYRELISEAQEILNEKGGRGGRRKGKGKTVTPEELKRRKLQSQAAKGVPTEEPTTKLDTQPVEDVPDEEGGLGLKPPNVKAGSKETQEKYKMDDAQPLESVIMGLRSIYDVGTMPGKQESKSFHKRIIKALETRESSNERHMKKVANKFYKRFFVEDENVEQKKLDDKMGELVNYTRNEAHRRLKPKLKNLLTDNDKRKALTADGVGTIDYLYDSLVKMYPYTGYAEKKASLKEGKDLESEIKACIYQRLYYIFIMYRFASAIGEIGILANPNQAVKYCEIKKLANGEKGNSQTDKSSFGTETNVQNIFNQAMEQVSQISTADITVMESIVNDANKFMGEDLGIEGGVGDAVTDAAGKVVGNVVNKVKNAADKRAEQANLPKVLKDFVGLMKMVISRKAFSPEKFNTLVKANELNKVDLMQSWLKKNTELAKNNSYLQSALDFMVYSKMSGPGGDPKWSERFAARNPKITASLKGAVGTAKIAGKAAKLVSKGLGKLI